MLTDTVPRYVVMISQRLMTTYTNAQGAATTCTTLLLLLLLLQILLLLLLLLLLLPLLLLPLMLLPPLLLLPLMLLPPLLLLLLLLILPSLLMMMLKWMGQPGSTVVCGPHQCLVDSRNHGISSKSAPCGISGPDVAALGVQLTSTGPRANHQ